jgi:ubiquinone/menaquinone biosynthesis C-methylase UbiE
MVALAREVNREPIAAGRLEILEAKADQLPFADATFTRAAMTGVLGFLPDPIAVLTEIRRVLTEHGRLVLFTGAPELRGTPAAPEPMARRLHFYQDEELEALAIAAGFAEVHVERPDLLQFARESGVPEEHLALFAGRDGQLLLASRG